MMLLRPTLLPLLGMVTWFAQPSNASVVSTMFEQYLKIETEIERSAAKGPDDRASDQVTTALRQLVSSWPRARQRAGNTNGYIFQNLRYHPWMVGDDYHTPAMTVHQAKDTADDWMCVCIRDSALVSSMGSNAERWLRADAVGLEDSESHEVLARDIKDAIARFHDETQVEIALALGTRNEVARAKYMTFVEGCMPEYS